MCYFEKESLQKIEVVKEGAVLDGPFCNLQNRKEEWKE